MKPASSSSSPATSEAPSEAEPPGPEAPFVRRRIAHKRPPLAIQEDPAFSFRSDNLSDLVETFVMPIMAHPAARDEGADAALALLLFGDPDTPMPGGFTSAELSASSTRTSWPGIGRDVEQLPQRGRGEGDGGARAAAQA